LSLNCWHLEGAPRFKDPTLIGAGIVDECGSSIGGSLIESERQDSLQEEQQKSVDQSLKKDFSEESKSFLKNETSCHAAVLKQHTEMVVAVEENFIQKVRDFGKSYKDTPKSSGNFVKVIEELIGKFNNEDDTQKLMISLLFCAISYGCEPLINLIISNPIEEFGEKISNEILIEAAGSKKKLSIEIYKKFFEYPFSAKSNAYDSEALVWAAENGYKELCNFLTTCVLAPAQASACHSRALRLAAQNGHYDVCELLLNCKENAAKADDVNS
jgi:hypothetical protein